jgi:hypothetical protein
MKDIFNMLACLVLIVSGILSFVLFWILGSKGKIIANKPKTIDLLGAIIIPPLLYFFNRLINMNINIIILINIGVGIAWGHTIYNLVFWQIRLRRK